MANTIRKAVIPVAGLGTRFLPATKAQPKEMLTLVDKPVIQYIVEEAVASGITTIIIVTSQTKRAVEDHFDRNFELEYRLMKDKKSALLKEVQAITKLATFVYVRQKSPRGWGDALLAVRPLVENEPFAYFSGDDVIKSKIPVMAQLMKVYEKYHDGVIGVTRVPKSETDKYGIVDPVAIERHTYQIRDIIEKPDPQRTPSTLAVTGRYIFTPDIFPTLLKTPLDTKGELVGTDAIRKLLKKKPFYAYEYEGTYYDCGNKLEYLKAQIDFALDRKEFAGPLRKALLQRLQK